MLPTGLSDDCCGHCMTNDGLLEFSNVQVLGFCDSYTHHNVSSKHSKVHYVVGHVNKYQVQGLHAQVDAHEATYPQTQHK